ncbi:hypothetical protein [Fischerella thermalis]|uniref:hypothetical protein n=1 Tax=Fischerella thermalis TaxID=372787 RepID=UPI0002EB8855|nr:hypothetical protein [Fischerella thermalis]
MVIGNWFSHYRLPITHYHDGATFLYTHEAYRIPVALVKSPLPLAENLNFNLLMKA